MPTNSLNFYLTDAVQNPLSGSQVFIRPVNNSGSFSSSPIYTFTDSNGSASFNNVIGSIFYFSYSNAGLASASLSSSNFVNYEWTEGYVTLPNPLTASVNFINYITGAPTASLTTGSANGVAGTAQQLGVDTSTMMNTIKNYLEDLTLQYGGGAWVAESIDEKINLGFNNCVGPSCLVVYTGEQPMADDSEYTGWYRMYWEVIIRRGKIMSDPRNTALTSITGPAPAFYLLMENVRDTVRTITFPQPMVYNPVRFEGSRPGRDDGWLMDSYIMSFSIPRQIGRPATEPYQLAQNGQPPYISLQDPNPVLPNFFPS